MNSNQGYRFPDQIEYNATKKLWVYQNEETHQTVYYTIKPKWIELHARCNQILDKTADPALVRQHHDELLHIAHTADNIYLGKINPIPIEHYVASLTEKSLLSPLHSIFELKLAYECKSSLCGGSMPSAQCNQARKFSAIVESLHRRIHILHLSRAPKDTSHFFSL